MTPAQAKARHEFCAARRQLRNAKAELARITGGTASPKRLDIAQAGVTRAQRLYEQKRQAWENAGRPT